MKRWAVHVLILAAGVAWPLAGAHAGSYGTELPFAAGVGARSSALGLASTSLPSSPSVQYFNAAALVGLYYREVEFYRTTLFDSDAQYHALSYVHPTLDYGTIAATVLRLDVGGIEERDGSNNLLSSDAGNSQTRILLGYAASVHAGLSAGLNLKIDHQSFGALSSTGIGVDVGLLVQHPMSGTGFLQTLRAGLAAENLIEPSVKLDQEDVADPMRLTLGGSVDARHGDFDFVTTLDVTNPRFSPVSARAGQEVRYADAVALRVGWDGSRPTFGVGGYYRHVSLDYAFLDGELGMNHRISLSVDFGASITERAEQRRERVDAEFRESVAHRVGQFEATQIGRVLSSADSLFSAGSYEDAGRQYEMALVLNPGNDAARGRAQECADRVAVRKADELMASEDYLTALYHLRQVGNPGPDVARRIAHCERRVMDARDRTTLTARTLKNAIDLYASGRYGDAAAAFDEVIRIDPANALAREYQAKSQANIDGQVRTSVNRAGEFAANGHYDSAIDLLAEALKMRPNDKGIQDQLADLDRRRQAVPTAKRSGEKPVGPAGPSRGSADARALDAKYERGLASFEAGMFDDAAHALLEVWTVSPEYRNVSDPLARAYLFVGMKAYSEERYTEALRIWEKVLAIEPGNAKAQRYLQKTREEASRLSGVQK